MQFALLYHEMPAGGDRVSHWDLLLEDPQRAGGSDDNERRLWTWALDVNPLTAAATGGKVSPIAAHMLPDHRAVYLSYEGELSDGRGRVSQIDCGQSEVRETQRAHGQLIKVVAKLFGAKLSGTITLERRQGSWHQPDAADAWQFSWIE